MALQRHVPVNAANVAKGQARIRRPWTGTWSSQVDIRTSPETFFGISDERRRQEQATGISEETDSGAAREKPDLSDASEAGSEGDEVLHPRAEEDWYCEGSGEFSLASGQIRRDERMRRRQEMHELRSEVDDFIHIRQQARIHEYEWPRMLQEDNNILHIQSTDDDTGFEFEPAFDLAAFERHQSNIFEELRRRLQ